jgi:gas vesicle protein
MTKSVKLAIASAALAGMVAGTSASMFAQDQSGSTSTDKSSKKTAKASKHVKEKHACKGQNSCKGKGGCKSGDNGCKGQNSCKGKGGCATDGSKMPDSQ